MPVIVGATVSTPWDGTRRKSGSSLDVHGTPQNRLFGALLRATEASIASPNLGSHRYPYEPRPPLQGPDSNSSRSSFSISSSSAPNAARSARSVVKINSKRSVGASIEPRPVLRSSQARKALAARS